MVEGRVLFLKRYFIKDEDLLEKYWTIMNEYFEKGYVERVFEEEVNIRDKLVWYFFRNLVIYYLKFDKVRVVYDRVVKFG